MMSTSEYQKISHERGYSVLELTVASILSACVLFIVFIVVTQYFRSQRQFSVQSELTEARNHIQNNLSCGATVGSARPPECQDLTLFMEIMAKSGDILIQIPTPATGYTRYGKYTFLRGRCMDCTTCAHGKRIVIEFLQGFPPQDPTKSIEPQPLLPDKTWEDMLRGIPVACVVPSA